MIMPGIELSVIPRIDISTMLRQGREEGFGDWRGDRRGTEGNGGRDVPGVRIAELGDT